MLDAGCGPGRDSRAFLAKGYDVTAFDASETMVRLASKRIGLPVLRLSFQEVGFEETFDGVWACASLLHVPRREVPSVLCRLTRSLKPDGLLYASFRYGREETVRGSRLFTDYTEDTFREMLQDVRELRLARLWETVDARPERADTLWLNVFLRRVG